MRLVKIKDIGTVVSGSTPKTNVPEYWGGEIAWATPKDLSLLDGQYLYDTAKKITQLGYDSCSTSLLPKDSVLFSSRAPIGLVAINKIPVCTNQGFKSIIPNKEVSSLYLYYALKYFSKTLERLGNGATFKELSKKTFEEFALPLPDISDQIRIADILSKAELLIRQRNESLRLLDEFLKSTFLEMFGDPVRNETDRNTKPLGERIRVKHGFAFQSKYFSSSGKYVLLTPGNFREEGGYRDRGDKQKFYIGEIPKKYVLKKGDLLVAMTEQAPGLLGSPIIIPESNKFLHNQRLGLLEFDRKYFNTHFLFYLFNTLSIRRIIHAKATGTKVRHTSPKKLEEIAIQYPPLESQNDFAAIVQKVQALKASNETSLSMLESLFKSLSSKAFKGQLDLKVESGKAESKGVHLYS